MSFWRSSIQVTWRGPAPSESRTVVEDGWVFDEWQTALGLQEAGKVKVQAFLRDGDALPPGFSLPATSDYDESWRLYESNTYDVRDATSLDVVLRAAFRHHGPMLSPSEWERANALYAEAQTALSAGEKDAAHRSAKRLADEFPQVPDGFAQLAQIECSADHHAAALAAARKALTVDPDYTDVLAFAALSAIKNDEYSEAVRYGATAIWTGVHVALAHWAVGNALDELLQVYPALAHLELARAALPMASVHNDTGTAYRRACQPLDALRCFEDAMTFAGGDDLPRVNAVAAAIETGDVALAQTHFRALGPHSPHYAQLAGIFAEWQRKGGPPSGLMKRLKPRDPVGIVTCTHCKAHIPLVSEDERLCAKCGVEQVGEPEPCPFCDHDGAVVPALGGGSLSWQCPYCRKGNLRFAPAT